MNTELTSLERVNTVLRGGIPDRVPVDLHNFLMVAQASGLPFPEFLQSGEAMAEGQIDGLARVRPRPAHPGKRHGRAG